MKKAAAIPLFGDAYMADTRHLSLEEHGAYLMLLMVAWRTDDCSLPDDDKRLARMLGISPTKWAKLKPSVLAFWTLENGAWSQARLTKERKFVDEKRAANAASAKARWDNQPPENKQQEQCERMSERNAPPPTPPQEGSKGEEAKASPPSAGEPKVNHFPKPEWADAQVWADFMVNRKNRKAKNTPTAYAGFLTDIANLTNDEWPPGRLLRYAVARSWAGIYEPKEGYPTSGRGQSQHHPNPKPSTRDIGQRLAAELGGTVQSRAAGDDGRSAHGLPSLGAAGGYGR